MDRRLIQAAFLVMLACLAAACATTGEYRKVDQAYLDSDSTFVLNVPMVRQKQASCCGAASLAMVAWYWLGGASPPDLPVAGPCPRAGFSGAELVDMSKALGLKAYLYSGSMQDLMRHLNATRPVIVMLEGRRPGAFHYTVACGYGPGGREIVLCDPGAGRIVMPLREFSPKWSAAGGFMIVDVPADCKKLDNSD